jgi:hypothetical protein
VSLLLLVAAAQSTVDLGPGSRPWRPGEWGMQFMLHSSGNGSAYASTLSLLQGCLARLARYQPTETPVQQLPKTSRMVELHDPVTRAGSGRKGAESGVHSMEHLEGAM